MANALDAILHLKDQEQQQQQFQSQQIAAAADLFQRAQAQAAQNQLAKLQMAQQASQFGTTNQLAQSEFANTQKQQGIANTLTQNTYTAGLAEKGLKQNKDGTYTYDPTTLNPTSQYISALKMQSDAKTAGNKQAYDMATGLLSSIIGGNKTAPVGGVIGQVIGGQPQVPVASGTDQAVSNPAVQGTATMTPTGQTSSTDPITGLTTGSTTMTNIPAKADEAGATDIGKAKADAAQSVATDAANLNMLTSTFKNLMDNYDQASKEGLAGSKFDKMKADYAQSPLFKGTEKIAAPNGISGAAAFVANRNELITKMQPMLSQQFGKAGSNRIMESLLNLAGKEIGNLDNPREVVQARTAATLKNFYRIAKGSIDYSQRLNVTPEQLKNMDAKGVENIAKDIWNTASISLSPEEEQRLNNIIDYSTNKNAPKFKPGDTAIKNGTTYIRQKDGTWIPKS